MYYNLRLIEIRDNILILTDDVCIIIWIFVPLIQVLCAMLEFEIIESADLKMQIITTLQSTTAGKRMYADLCERQIQLRELVRIPSF